MWYIYTQWNITQSLTGTKQGCLQTWMDLEYVIQSEIKEKNKSILTHICEIQENGTDETISKAGIETHTQFIGFQNKTKSLKQQDSFKQNLTWEYQHN